MRKQIISVNKTKQFEADLFEAAEWWILRGNKVSAGLGNFWLNAKNKTTICNALTCMIIRNKMKVKTYYTSHARTSGVNYATTIAFNLAEYYKLPKSWVLGYYLGVESPLRNPGGWNNSKKNSYPVYGYKRYSPAQLADGIMASKPIRTILNTIIDVEQ